ncbi:MAG TPA: hypothetical protein G4O16_00150 [Dehalococcoidia bacterium]|nr:hypothetical protein [Dehalococcoidia bacterium]
MARYLLFAFSDCKDPAREEEFNEWYDNVHIPDILAVPGMISATRWESAHSVEGQRRKYLALYELETDNLAEFDAGVRERGMWTMREGRFSDLPEFDPPNIPRVYKQIMPEKRPLKARG